MTDVPPVLVGVSVRVPEPWAGQLQEARAGYGDPVARHVPPHVTILPPTPVAPAQQAAVLEHLDRVVAAHRAFVLHLRGTGTFRPVSPVAYVDVAEGGDACARLEAAVRRGPLWAEQRFAYRPHVTVAHHVDDAALDAAERDWADLDAQFLVTTVECAALDPDGRWRTLRVHPLAGPDRPVPLPDPPTGEHPVVRAALRRLRHRPS
ncbi:2'-5' RNA ligase family protein [Cellulomonas marina]|uniref:2'-5' RNA ligase n=1 Tax=Cellulomonas marina TaxID=988821 RepID=A0A1I0ZK84_9CELL|nr:2'-5' RNA ligase family protein [Cellulomonas marina]GIG28623.1 phosphoesterase [Cellulomonas marina]SFB25526.1 2'-5' RNA ligase [Cellulomonas marina]